MSKLDHFKARIEATFSPVDYLQANQKQPGTMLLVDVRNPPPQKLSQKIAEAVMIPQAEMESRLSELPKDKTIVVYCWDVWCNLGARAAVLLLENGFDVIELNGGIAAWSSMNLPMEELSAS